MKATKLYLVAATLLLAGCNEKVSPELQNSGMTAPSGGPSTPTTPTTAYSFKLINTAQDVLNYKLHKTGLGNANAKCEINSASTPFSNRTFVNRVDHDNDPNTPAIVAGTNPDRDITCYLEAEELSLYAEGLSLQIEASPNACEFVSYSPFSYYNRQPGDSSGSYKQITCTNDDTNDNHVAQSLSGISYDPDGPGGSGPTSIAGCGDWVSEHPLLNSPSVIRNKFSEPESDEHLCRFNYQNGDKEKCDIGEITVNEWEVTWDKAAAEAAAEGPATASALASNSLYGNYTDGVDGDGTGPDDNSTALSADEKAAIEETVEYQNEYLTVFNALVAAHPPKPAKLVTRRIKCGGSPANCISGPIKSHSELKSVRGSLITTIPKGSAYAKKHEYPSLLPDRAGTFVYANFRRNLANRNVAFAGLNDAMTSSYWTNFVDFKTFDPMTMERYARNRTYDGFLNIDSTTLDTYSVENFTYSARPLAAEPFLGVDMAYYTNPFYTFECLDTAREPKARIRLVVRDWDRIFPTQNLDGTNNTDLELITDIYKTDPVDLARQDIRGTEDGGDFGDWDDWNDFWDWDDLIYMDRTTSAPLIFRPTVGYFSPLTFPNESKSKD